MTDREKYTPTKVFLEQLAETTHQAENVCQSCGNTRAISAPKVKPLVWDRNGDHYAGGFGFVIRKLGAVFVLTMAGSNPPQDFDTLEEAQGLAQSHHEAAVLSALEPTADTSAEIRAEAFREAAEIAETIYDDMVNAALTGLPEQARLRESMANTAEKIKVQILSLIDKEGAK